jgi:hypothetical protein
LAKQDLVLRRLRVCVAVGAAWAALAAWTPAPRAERPFRCVAPVPATLAYPCLGAAAGAQALAHELGALRPNANVEAMAHLAARLDATEAVPPLRALLEPSSPVTRGSGLAAVAEALADFGDTSAAPALVALARRSEGVNATAWQGAVHALAKLDRAHTLAYAKDLVGRIRDIDGPDGADRVRFVAAAARDSGDHALLPVLAGWAAKAHNESVQAVIAEARLALDDPALRPQRRRLGVRNAVVPTGLEHWLAGMGALPEDAPALVRFASSDGGEARAAYEGILRLARVKAARPQLLAGLEAWTRYREDRASPRFSGRLLAMHHAALAALGREASRRRLVELVAEPPDTTTPWVAARWSLAYPAPGGDDAIADLLARGADSAQSPVGDPDDRLALLDTLAGAWAGRDPRWALMLLAPHPVVRGAALGPFTRLKPAACDVVTAGARRARAEAAQDGLLALTALGPACAGALGKLLEDAAAPVAARGTALEVLTMLGGAAPAGDALAGVAGARGYRDRAGQIAALGAKH